MSAADNAVGGMRFPGLSDWGSTIHCSRLPGVFGTVSAPIHWEEVDNCEPDDFTIATMPARYAELGDLHAGIDEAVFDLSPLLEWAERDEEAGAEPPVEPEE